MSEPKMFKVALADLTRDQLVQIIAEQAIFTEGMRKVCNAYCAHAGHVISNYAKDIPEEKSKDLAKAWIDATALLTYPAPVGPPQTQ